MANLVRVKEKFQVTIPVAVRDQLGVAEGDYLEASVSGSTIVLQPKRLSDGTSATPTITQFLKGREPGNRSRAEIDAAVSDERDAWK